MKWDGIYRKNLKGKNLPFFLNCFEFFEFFWVQISYKAFFLFLTGIEGLAGFFILMGFSDFIVRLSEFYNEFAQFLNEFWEVEFSGLILRLSRVIYGFWVGL
jgi:hypothetical protein